MQRLVSESADQFTPREKLLHSKEMQSRDELQLPTEAEGELENVDNNAGDDPLLIFAEDNLKQLQRRTEELKTERAMQKNKFK